jgi:hypothetical protein
MKTYTITKDLILDALEEESLGVAGLTVDEVRDHMTDWVEANVPDDYRLVATASEQ